VETPSASNEDPSDTQHSTKEQLKDLGRDGLKQGKEAAADQADTVADALRETADHLGERNASLAEYAQRLADAAETLSNKADAVKERVAGTAQAVTLQARRAREGFTQLLEEQPLLVGACALAIGAFIGYSLPATETEDRWMGDARDRTVQRAKEAGAEQYAEARKSAADVTQSKEGSPSTHC
jgi:ABC-type transporter Mla subunit MlaD